MVGSIESTKPKFHDEYQCFVNAPVDEMPWLRLNYRMVGAMQQGRRAPFEYFWKTQSRECWTMDAYL